MGRLMLSKEGRARYEAFFVGAGRRCAAAGISPAALTLASVAVAGFTAALLARGHLLWAIPVGGLSALLDMLDGATARAAARANGFGTLLDRVADRVSESLFLLGFLLGGHAPAWLVLVTLFALLSPSYVRALAESVAGMDDCEVGWAGRLEKMVVLALGTIGQAFWPQHRPLALAMALVAVLSLATATQRVLAARAASDHPGRWRGREANPAGGDREP